METNNGRYLPKLTDEQVLEIKELLRDERCIRQVWIAKKFGVSQSTVAYYNRKLKSDLVENK